MFDTLTRLGSSNPSGYEIERSLRFNSVDSAYLSRTPSSAGNRKTFTLSFWFKPVPYFNGRIFESGSASGSNGSAFYYSDEKFGWVYDTGPTFYAGTTTPLFRDNSAWYHVCVQFDTTQGTSSNRIKTYVNNQLHGMSSYPPQNLDLHLNNNIHHSIGRRSHQNDNFIHGYMAEMHLIDGTVVAPTEFAETNTKTGQWIPKKYEGGNYGTNGFYLNFSDNSGTTDTTLGKDSSGQDNHWTPNNFSVSAGSDNDSVTDTPTNNYCVMNNLLNGPRDHGDDSSAVFANGNLKVTCNGSGDDVAGTIGVEQGKWYYEVKLVEQQNHGAGWTRIVDFNNNEFAESNEGIVNMDGHIGTKGANKIVNNGTESNATNNWDDDDIIGFAFDIDARELKIYHNGSLDTTLSNLEDTASPWVPIVGDSSSTDAAFEVNFGQQGFTYTPPAGYKELCTKNLPEPDIKKPTDYFNTVLYTGNSNTSQNITGVGFQPDLVWVKNRDNTERHHLVDSVRGNNLVLMPDVDDPERTGSHDDGHTQLNLASDGFNLVSNGSNDNLNYGSRSYVAWCWKEANDKGFDIVSFTPSSGANTYSHNLGTKPDFIIFKSRDSDAAWDVYHDRLGEQYKLNLNTYSPKIDSGFMNDTAPTASVFTFDPGSQDGDDHIAYCFNNVAGFSRAGLYRGHGTNSGSDDGTFVWTGFRPAFLLIKKVDSTNNDWEIRDNKRPKAGSNGTYNPVQARLMPNNTSTENNKKVDFYANGFKFRQSFSGGNNAGLKYIYVAFAEQSFKYANAY